MTRRALILEDSRTMRALLARMLHDLGFEAVPAGHVEEALDRLRGGSGVELALVDWNLPGLSGMDFLRRLRADPAHRAIRVLVVSTEVGQHRVEEALREGAQEYLMKPFTRDMLAEKLALMGVEGP